MEQSRRRIVYVDDVNHSLISLKERLKSKYEIYPAQSVAIMFEILSRTTPDLILLDVNMPGVGGFDAIKRLKADARYSGIPVVFLTSQNDKDSVFIGLNLGASAYVNKPYTAESLIETIESVFNPDLKRNPFKEMMDEEESEKPCILAVDDVTIVLHTIRHALQDLYKIYMLTNPAELETMLRSITPKLFLLDYGMPGLTGFDLIPIIRKFPEHKNTPIIFVTGDNTVEHMTKAAALGACDYILKPIKNNILRDKIAKHIKKQE
jgi:CheY-like chemotaxis protein